MKKLLIFILFFLVVFSGCGKSPLLSLFPENSAGDNNGGGGGGSSTGMTFAKAFDKANFLAKIWASDAIIVSFMSSALDDLGCGDWSIEYSAVSKKSGSTYPFYSVTVNADGSTSAKVTGYTTAAPSSPTGFNDSWSKIPDSSTWVTDYKTKEPGATSVGVDRVFTMGGMGSLTIRLILTNPPDKNINYNLTLVPSYSLVKE